MIDEKFKHFQLLLIIQRKEPMISIAKAAAKTSMNVKQHFLVRIFVTTPTAPINVPAQKDMSQLIMDTHVEPILVRE